jgi:4-amino-4-deoxy-L-arabinose transferase-like glycosyltransferase
VNILLKIWLLALVIKLLLTAFIPLYDDEAYYWVWSRHLQLSYLDHPPFVAWLFLLGTPLEPLFHTVRWPAVLLSHGTFLIWLKILRPVMSERQLFWWLCLSLTSPFFGMGSLIATPDIPLMFFWSLSLLAMLKAMETGDPRWYGAFGCFLGLGFCSKYQIVLFIPAALLWLVFSRRLKSVHWRWLPLTLAAGFLFSLPVLYWNYQNDFVSFRFQLTHGLAGGSWNPDWTLEYIFSQIGIIFPTILYLALRRWPSRETDYLPYFGWFPILFFLWSSTQAHVEANWPTMAHAPIIALAVLNARKETLLKFTFGFWLVSVIVASSELVFNWLPLPRKEKLHEHAEYDDLVDVASRNHPVYGSRNQMAAQLTYKLKKNIYKLRSKKLNSFYDYREDSIPKEDRFYVLLHKNKSLSGFHTSGYTVVSKTPIEDRFIIYELQKSPDTKTSPQSAPDG